MLLQHNQVLGMIEKARGEFKIPAAQLGIGPTALRVVGVMPAPATPAPAPADPAAAAPPPATPQFVSVQAQPIQLKILPPPIAKPPADAPKGELAAGAELTKADGSNQVWDKDEAGWLRQRGVKAGEKFTVSGWLEVGADGIGQIQVRNLPLTGKITVNGKDLLTIEGDAGQWRYAPLHLAAGRHRLVVTGIADEAALAGCDIRLGMSGSRPMGIVLKH